MIVDIKLDHLCACPLPGVLDVHTGDKGDLVRQRTCLDVEVAIVEGCVGEAVTKWVVDLHPACIVGSVADMDTFTVIDALVLAREIQIGRCILQTQRNGLGQLAARINVAEQDVGDRFAVGLTGQPELDNRVDRSSLRSCGDDCPIAHHNNRFWRD